jgi:uncharacterized protein YecE (DUF72 family)
MMISTNIGCSGFHYKHWKGSFYPEKLAQKHWFRYYCEHFNTLELNVTFYRFPRVHTLQQWYRDSPADFRFAVKAPRAITQFKKFLGTERMLDDFYKAVQDGLQEKCGCCLFQMPPNFQYSIDKLDRIINSLDPSIPNVMEFRHSSWWNNTVFEQLSANQISFCGMSHPLLPEPLIRTAPLFYYRFHGKEQLYASAYGLDELQGFADTLMQNTLPTTAFIYFNNDINTHAIYNAGELKRILSKF